MLLLTPYEYWRKTHAYHHAHSGNLSFHGFGDIDTFTVKEYLSWPRLKRLEYRIYRNPFVLTVGLGDFLKVQLPVTLLACSLGVWLFYVQHQFEHTYWHWREQWDYYDASPYGSSYLVLPKPLQWITANIGVHHVHHMSARIPKRLKAAA